MKKQHTDTIIPPTSDEEWSIHALNIHGTFFERWTEKLINTTASWKVQSTQYPVEFPPPNGPWRGKESVLDIRAEHKKEERLLTLPIECKKNNPEFTNWIFFEKYPDGESRPVRASLITNSVRPTPKTGWGVQMAIAPLLSGLVITNEGRETKGKYMELSKKQQGKQNLTKTSNAAITEAAQQVALATQAILTEDYNRNMTLSSQNPPASVPYHQQFILPVIVTTAKLFVCSFNSNDVEPGTGEIPFNKTQLTEQGCLVYEYPLPRSLQKSPENVVEAITTSNFDSFMRMDIIVVNSLHLSRLLTTFNEII